MVKIDEIRTMLFKEIEVIATKEGFKQKKGGQVGGLLRITKKITDVIGWGIYDYGELKQFAGFSAYNCHNEVREITLPILVKHKLMGSNAAIKDWSYTFCPRESYPKKMMNDFGFKTLDEIGFFKELYRDFIINEALPYFKRWNNLLKVYDYVKDIKDDSETGLGQFPQYEKAVILRLCNDERYKEYFASYFSQTKTYYLEAPQNRDNENYFNAAQEMMEFLDTIEPRYNL